MNTDARAQLINIMIDRIIIGLSISSFQGGKAEMRKYPKKVLAKHIATRPIILINPPIPLVIKNVAEFFKASLKALSAAMQKFSFVNATWQ